MQRIDENTYIDDSLVTCAEYQLFIDEMREQGKYYQPDHWTSYQFPKGQARELILGVRYSDAVAFCDWLTQREDGEWNYRLPISKEASIHFAYLFTDQLLYGCWVTGISNTNQFSWLGPAPINSHAMTSTSIIDFTIPVARPLDLANTRECTFNLIETSDRVRIRDRPRVRALNLDLTATLDRVLNRNLNLEIKRNRDLNRYRTLILNRLRTLNHDRSLANDIIMDIDTLQNRIAGRSPAFEGIRLVKERTK